MVPRHGLQEILHDLRSPLTVIRLYAELLAEHARKGEPPVGDHLQNLRAEIELMESLLESTARRGRPCACAAGGASASTW